MKFLTLSFVLSISISLAQPNTDVFIMDLERTDTTFFVSNLKKISKNEGYNNQPSFLDNNRLLYAGNENAQTEIQMYTLSEKMQQRVNATTPGGEYSPMPYPGNDKIAAVRLDTTGLQRLYAYDINTPGLGNSTMLLSKIEVAYYAFHNENKLVASVLSGGQLDVVIADITKDEAILYAENAGRSIHKVPNSPMMSYTIVNEEKNHDVYLVDVTKPEETYFVCQLPTGIQDHTWLDANTLLLGSGSKLYTYSLFGPEKWVEVADLSKFKVQDISRMAISPNGKHLAFAAAGQLVPAAIVDAHIDPFNNGAIDAFANAFSEDVVVSRFPSNIISKGRDELKNGYARFFKNNKSWHVEVKNRMVFKNFVIDEEVATVNGIKNKQVTIYETKDGLIQTMTFISNKIAADPLPPVLAQMKAYNNRNIDAFMMAYAENIQIYNYPHELRTKGKSNMESGYATFFKNTPDLNYTVPKRLVIGNIVIDKELITANGTEFSAVAIYEIDEGKILKVTFLQ